ncbi:phage tail sheath C-terminal domain-containing protein [Myxococcus sp. RHSTA-1-4]|uniref:phage tail sheath family protein n=1 Tax=Myxococcus sp. RHSTA-1-4 TaxID=2874601 RepID=UPI001CC01BB6|nr:phage tail sheath C-terminal domain-containing protein [Myxococcus sp. RHSTA-1-4]MBZ4417441.1 phage tail sheath subtilisin-like domain-containing protein [Myxococcus sp. RHSTA-1-4]
MAFNIGLNVVEVDGEGTPALAGAAASVAAFNVTTWRGVPNRPVRLTSFAKFVEHFGGFSRDEPGAFLVKGFFDNGGQTAWVNRVVGTDPNTGALPASLPLRNGGGAVTLLLEAGSRGEGDPGTWGDGLHVQVSARATASSRVRETAPASIQGSPLTEPLDMSGLPPLSLKVDGEDSVTLIAFQPSDFPSPAQATAGQVREAINRRTSKVVASLSGDNRLVLTSTGTSARLRRDFTRLQVTDTNATLGFTVMAAPVVGTPAAVSGTGTQLMFLDGFKPGAAVRISDGTNTAHAKLQSVDPLTRAVTWAPAVSGIGDFSVTGLRVESVEFDLTVALGSPPREHVVEQWTGLSMEPDVDTYAPRVLNDSQRGSRYIRARDTESSSPPGQNVPAASASFLRFDPGRDGTPTANDFIGDEAGHTGFHAFDAFDVQLLGTERTEPGIVAAALTYCERRGDCMFVGAVPEGSVETGEAAAYGQSFQGRKVYGALYGPWIVVADPLGTGAEPRRKLPPTGHVMGVYARIESSRGVWKAPAGDEANLRGVLDVEYRLSEAEHTELVVNGSVNGIRAVPRAGIVVDASRTLSTDSRWRYVNVRLLFNFVKSSLKQGLRWVRQEPNRDALWKAVRLGSVTPFLMGLWRQGAFGTGTPEQTFTVICDETNNPPELVEQGYLNVEVYFYPSRPAETIVIKVGQQPGGGSASEA